VILPITDPYVKHHGALGSNATVFLQAQVSPADVLALLNQQPDVELVLSRDAAAKTFDLPADRVGDVVVIGDRGTSLGKSQRRWIYPSSAACVSVRTAGSRIATSISCFRAP
jgi:phosphonoacetate hydrolase